MSPSAPNAASPANPTASVAVPPAWAEPVAWYVERLVALSGQRLEAITLYGHWPQEPARRGPTLSSVAVFDRIDLETLRRVGREGHRFGAWGFSAPWALTRTAIDRSRDTFPLELIEIVQRRAPLHGPDFFADLTIHPTHVRLACERELRVLEIHLQRGVLTAGDDEEHLGRVGAHALHTLLRILAGLAWLTGRYDYEGPFARVATAERLLDRELLGVRRTMDHSDTAYRHKFHLLHADIQALGDSADRWS
ncbi:MAG TPA: hypothetical protein VMF30_04205 [Pirellulales bacterium]|nr:hypothetical protein [Pirellulales bacterium]